MVQELVESTEVIPIPRTTGGRKIAIVRAAQSHQHSTVLFPPRGRLVSVGRERPSPEQGSFAADRDEAGQRLDRYTDSGVS